jgi:hypothetical protein
VAGLAAVAMARVGEAAGRVAGTWAAAKMEAETGAAVKEVVGVAATWGARRVAATEVVECLAATSGA